MSLLLSPPTLAAKFFTEAFMTNTNDDLFSVKGDFVTLNGEEFYRISNFDRMDDFFMTVTSSSDVWNFCWSKGGLTAGRGDSNHSIFPYYTADKIQDVKYSTGPYTAIIAEGKEGLEFWEPFSCFFTSSREGTWGRKNFIRNIYKNVTGTHVWFEEENLGLGLTFRYGWTSSEKFGLVRTVCIINNTAEQKRIHLLDGARNILPACCTSAFQNDNSVLLDAYKKTDLIEDGNLALFTVSSIVSDKAEPNEGLFANSCWFTGNSPLYLDPALPRKFAAWYGELEDSGADSLSGDRGFVPETLHTTEGSRPAAWICRAMTIAPGKSEEWCQVFDTNLDHSAVGRLISRLEDRETTVSELAEDIAEGKSMLLNQLVGAADGLQETADRMACVHHTANVMFNIMRGGIFADQGFIKPEDFVDFAGIRNRALKAQAAELVECLRQNSSVSDPVPYSQFYAAVSESGNPQLMRLFFEYMPLTFSRRHGDPSRPWNQFSIILKDEEKKPILNYQGNWRDIFQNWEALAWSYPSYTKNMVAKFLNAMTIDGFNPYHISKDGLNWEVPDPTNPWAQIGYWGDHQVIYLEKLLEFFRMISPSELYGMLDQKIFSTANVPYRLKSYEEIRRNPHNTIVFDKALHADLCAKAETYGSDAKLVADRDGNPALVTMITKLLQIVVCKAANFVAGGGIWLNTQRPEWNDANNALAGNGLSMVTLCYLYRYLVFLKGLLENAPQEEFEVSAAVYRCFHDLGTLYAETDCTVAASESAPRTEFMNRQGAIFETERTELYSNGFASGEVKADRKALVQALDAIIRHAEHTILRNRHEDGLFHSYNVLHDDSSMEIEHLEPMLEGQVAVLSSGLLSPSEAVELTEKLAESSLYEPRQNAYMLYPDKKLKDFAEKNCIAKNDVEKLRGLIARSGGLYLKEDCNGIYHFNGLFRNRTVLKDFIAGIEDDRRPTAEEEAELFALYENTFNHRSFTGRSGTFFAYEGIGSIYWHMVSKLLLAVQENALSAEEAGFGKEAALLAKAFRRIQEGLSFRKSPKVYGAFPADPYSHTPKAQGAKQPGMTGQVKEEILARFNELGLCVRDQKAVFMPWLLEKSEFIRSGEDGLERKLCFTWCGTKIVYRLAEIPAIAVSTDRGLECRKGSSLTAEETESLFARDGRIKEITVDVVL